ncbi:MAG: hypothetical protein EPN75_10800 [Beijerinckiaceae bacterium]|nr:MAG: hypothetical protein EPN75_10800 [Beijerinckiaceae bacterium]
MHVHSHFRHFALQPKTPAQTRETRKKAAGLENSERVESRFSEEDEESSGQRKGQQGRPFVSEESQTTTPSVHVVSAPRISSPSSLLAISVNAAPGSGDPEIKAKPAAAEFSLESLLALTRAAARES